jgi:enoyl-CoA hydratase/carnithine racemase/3-hydroxyacyl-CoA dehydrogenase
MDTLNVEIGPDGIAVAALDVPGRSMNTIGDGVIADFAELIGNLQADDSIVGLVIVSGKTSGFCAGADLGELARRIGPPAGGVTPERLQADFEVTGTFSRLLRRLETCGKPVAVVIDGVALGGGLELALAAHRRIAVDHPRTKLGLPEATIGLLPGAGGTQRLPRLAGILPALPLLLEGKPVSAAQAAMLGIVHAVSADAEEALAAAKAWIREGGRPVQPWDEKGYRIPGGAPFAPAVQAGLSVANGAQLAENHGNYPALTNIMRCVFEGVQVPIDAGLRIETRYFVRTLHTQQAQAMVRTSFLSVQELAREARRADPNAAESDPLPDYVRRLGTAYARAALALLADGVSAAAVENGARMAGFSKTPLASIDETGLAEMAVKCSLLDGLLSRGRTGAGSGKGFYDYAEGRPTRLWPGLEMLSEAPRREIGRDGAEELKRRILYPLALEAARCMVEGLIADPRHADVGAVNRFGFPAWTGGPLSLIDALGASAFLSACEAMGLEVPEPLYQLAADDFGFYRRRGDALPATAAPPT